MFCYRYLEPLQQPGGVRRRMPRQPGCMWCAPTSLRLSFWMPFGDLRLLIVVALLEAGITAIYRIYEQFYNCDEDLLIIWVSSGSIGVARIRRYPHRALSAGVQTGDPSHLQRWSESREQFEMAKRKNLAHGIKTKRILGADSSMETYTLLVRPIFFNDLTLPDRA
ncbi:unnamed protein product [Cyclocybe aegerita]|uniref:Uncharacterized protein n=1 Tax=Cyclocybe aegerita TaxID=1973307 RepID=A0A8S0VW94_CYCAE|nr:unnamed protein product [Cyclocybe aegerita]